MARLLVEIKAAGLQPAITHVVPEASHAFAVAGFVMDRQAAPYTGPPRTTWEALLRERKAVAL